MAELMKKSILVPLCLLILSGCMDTGEKRGVVVYPSDIVSIGIDGWKNRIEKSGINLIGIHAATFNEPLDSLRAFVESPVGKEFLALCQKMGVDVEYELHALQMLLPRSEFVEHPEYFRMDSNGDRRQKYNMCFTNECAYEAMRPQIEELLSWMRPTTHRYFIWPDDVKGAFCCCDKCKEYSPSEQAVLYENRILAMLREYDPKATLAHLAYHQTLAAPVKVSPEDGVFLEFAPISRDYAQPLSAELKESLEANFGVFPRNTSHILEYWLDESMFSSWKRGALVELPFDEQACRRDINWYRNQGVASITTFATWLGADYESSHGSADWAFEGYGRSFSNGFSKESFRIGRKECSVDGFYAPWSGKADDTRLLMRRSKDSLYFRFEVNEDSYALADTVVSERDIEPEDRVELFFSPTEDMSKPYYGIEIDPLGRVLDYKVDYYRDFDYSWTFPGTSVSSLKKDGSYSVEVRFSIEALNSLGLGRNFWLGAFRDDFLQDGDVIWYSRRPTSDKIPDFHKPDVLIPVKI